MTTTTTDLHERAYNLGYEGKPMTEALKRQAETDHSIFEAWQEGRSDRAVDDVHDEPEETETEDEPEETASEGPPGRSSRRRARRSRSSSGPHILRRASAPYKRGAVGTAITVTGLFFAALLLVLLYVLLMNGQVVASFFSGIVRGLELLMDPIPFFA